MNATRSRWLEHSAFAIALLVTVAATVSGQEHVVNMTDLIADTQKETPDPDRVTTVWWLPEEYWSISMGEADAEDALAVLRPYVVIGVIDGPIGPFGGIDFSSREELVGAVRLEDGDGAVHAPLDPGTIDPDVRSLLSMMTPYLSSILGQMGQNLHFFVFDGQKGGSPLLNAREEGSFAVLVREERFEWRLPLGSLLPPKYCPVDGEKLSGAWNYCPWHGAELKSSGS